jgi:hypothetical protein
MPTETSINLVQLSAVIGTGLPLVAAVMKQDGLGSKANATIAAAVALAAAVVIVNMRGEFGMGNLVASFTAAYTTAVAFHHGLWKPTGIAAAIQMHTTVRRKARPIVESTALREDESDLARC